MGLSACNLSSLRNRLFKTQKLAWITHKSVSYTLHSLPPYLPPMKKFSRVLLAGVLAASAAAANASFIVRVPVNPTATSAPSTASSASNALVVDYSDPLMYASSTQFGPVPVGSDCSGNSCEDVAIKNTGSTSVALTSVSTLSAPLVTATPYGGVPQCTAGYSLAAGATCYLNVGYAAVQAGSFSQALNVVGDNGQTLSIPVSVQGVTNEPLYSMDGNVENVGNIRVGTTFNPDNVNGTTLYVQVASPSDTNTYTVTGISAPAGSDFTLNPDSCPVGTQLTAAGGGTCYVVFNFTPSTVGPQTVNATFTYSDQNGVQYSYPLVLEGTGTPPPGVLNVGTPSYTTNSSGAVTAASVAVSNSSQSASTLTVSAVTGVASPFSLTSDGCTGKTLNQGQSCTLTFSNSGGSTSDVVTVQTQDGQSQSVTLLSTSHPGYALFNENGYMGAFQYLGGSATCTAVAGHGDNTILDASTDFVLNPNSPRNSTYPTTSYAVSFNTSYGYYVAQVDYEYPDICLPVPDYTILPAFNGSAAPILSGNAQNDAYVQTTFNNLIHGLWSGATLSAVDNAVGFIDLRPVGGSLYIGEEADYQATDSTCPGYFGFVYMGKMQDYTGLYTTSMSTGLGNPSVCQVYANIHTSKTPNDGSKDTMTVAPSGVTVN